MKPGLVYLRLWFCLLWLFRNDVVFNGKSFDLMNLLFIFKSRLAWWSKAKYPDYHATLDEIIADPATIESVLIKKSCAAAPAVWCPPPIGWLKLNVDVAMNVEGSAGVLRNEAGICLASFSQPLLCRSRS
ncbi:hypothetical protein like AT3G25270 [Hibiscus trionum]|uniref:RNase H type-1 domain-containing protein n=1 Tax=Hibiscus trionum TaxID=183268 RepID=A0A9W7H5W1_HIBTR|nr:hypothetical protein like AT3G25270 [Hibiscus trionum]